MAIRTVLVVGVILWTLASCVDSGDDGCERLVCHSDHIVVDGLVFDGRSVRAADGQAFFECDEDPFYGTCLLDDSISGGALSLRLALDEANLPIGPTSPDCSLHRLDVVVPLSDEGGLGEGSLFDLPTQGSDGDDVGKIIAAAVCSNDGNTVSGQADPLAVYSMVGGHAAISRTGTGGWSISGRIELLRSSDSYEGVPERIVIEGFQHSCEVKGNDC